MIDTAFKIIGMVVYQVDKIVKELSKGAMRAEFGNNSKQTRVPAR